MYQRHLICEVAGINMVFSCSVDGCRSNFPGTSEENVTVFEFPSDNDVLCALWEKFAAGARNDWTVKNSSRICIKHFKPQYVKKGDGPNGRCRLLKQLKPVPTIFSPKDSPVVSHMKAPRISAPRKSPKKRLFQEDQYQKFLDDDMIRSYDEIDDTLTPTGYTLTRYDHHLVFYKVTINNLSVPEVTECIRIDNDLHVKLFYKGSPVPLPEWFRKGRDCKLSRKSMLQNLPNYVKLEGEQTSSIFEELKQIQFQKKPKYSNNVIRYALLLRYTSLQSYRLVANDFPLPSLSFLKKITQGGIDAVKALANVERKGKDFQGRCSYI